MKEWLLIIAVISSNGTTIRDSLQPMETWEECTERAAAVIFHAGKESDTSVLIYCTENDRFHEGF